MKLRRNILLTFDYELFLGTRSGTVQNCLLRPTDELLKVLSRQHAKAIFFIDTLFLYRLKQEMRINKIIEIDYYKIKQQIKTIHQRGHDVFQHLHPHWMRARYDPINGQWSYDESASFTISSVSATEREEIFDLSNQIFDDFIPSKNEFGSNGFRAGGLYIQPVSLFKKFFEEAGIRYDFSVLPGYSSNQKNYGFDFTRVSRQEPYHFNDDVTIPESIGAFTEFPISSVHITGFPKIINGVVSRLQGKKGKGNRWGDGISSSNRIQPLKKNTKWSSTETASVELLNLQKIPIYFDALQSCSFFHMISHPKLFSPTSLSSFERLLELASEKFDLEFDFLKIENELLKTPN